MQSEWSQARPGLFHFRDRDGIEVDLVLESGDGRVVGVEVKAGATVRAEDLRGLRLLEHRLGTDFATGIMLCTATQPRHLGGRLWTLPLSVFLAAALCYAGEYTRATPLFDVIGRDHRRYLAPSDAVVLDSSYHAGHAYAQIDEPDKALPQLRFYLHHVSATEGEETDKILGSRFTLAQTLATSGRPDDALTELESIRPSWPSPSALTRLRSATSTGTSTSWCRAWEKSEPHAWQ